MRISTNKGVALLVVTVGCYFFFWLIYTANLLTGNVSVLLKPRTAKKPFC